MYKNELKILLIGPLPPTIGGTTVSFRNLVGEISSRNDVKVLLVNTSVGGRGGLLKDIKRFAITNLSVLRLINISDIVSLHIDAARLPHLGIFIFLWAKLMRKPLIVRKFGGTSYKDYSRPLNWIGRYIASNCDLYLTQSKLLLNEAYRDGLRNVQWFPTSRPVSNKKDKNKKTKCRRFVYVGHVKSSKGIYELIEASKSLGTEASIDVYGPFYEGLSPHLFSGLDRINYCGVIEPDNVVGIMLDYDALVYPTHHKTEGYPGALIEAFDAGIPIICTRWRALPELVDENNGILVEPYDSNGLSEAMNKLVNDDALYQKLCKGMDRKKGVFNSKVWADKLVEFCHQVLKLKK
jgi:glycosyltransferase involved in cell wall biosynthesis